MLTDRLTRQVNNTITYVVGTTEIATDNPSRALIPGEWVTFAGDTVVYPVTASTRTQQTIGTGDGQSAAGLRSTLADDVLMTRQDLYAPLDFESVLDFVGYDGANEGQEAEIYKASLMTRRMCERTIGGFIKARTQTKTYSLNAESRTLYLNELRVESVTSITISDVAVTGDYTLNQEQGYIYFDDGTFPAGVEHIDVVYRPGWSYPDPDIIMAYLQATKFMYALSGQGLDAMIMADKAIAGAVSGIRSLTDIQQFLNDQLMPFRKIHV